MIGALQNAIGAYSQIQNTGAAKKNAINQSQQSSDHFAHMVQDALQNTQQALQSSEQLSVRSLTDDSTSTIDVVTAISQAEVALNTMVAVRDKVVQAYQDIIRMQI